MSESPTPAPTPLPTQSTSYSWSPVVTTLVISVAQFVALYVLFETWRTDPGKAGIYRTRHATKSHRSPPFPGRGWFGWARSTLAVSDEETHRCVGLDTFILLRILRMCFKITTVAAFFGCVVLIPLYATGDNPEEGTVQYNLITLANVNNKSNRLWVTLIFWWFFVCGILYMLWLEWSDYQVLRYKFLAEGDIDTPEEYRYTVLLEQIPENKRTSEGVRRYFEDLFPGQVSQASVCLHTEELEKILAELETTVAKYESTVAVKTFAPDKPEPQVRVGGAICCGGEKKDALAHYEAEIKRLHTLAKEEYQRIMDRVAANDTGSRKSISIPGVTTLSTPMGPLGIASATGFVSFNTLCAKQAAVQCELSGKASYMEAQSAPEPKDVLWANITTPILMQKMKTLVCNGLWSLGILFWAIPVTAVQAIANIDSLKKRWNWIPVPPSDSVAYGLLTGLLPVLALIVLMMVIPIAINISALKIIKMKSYSAADLYTLKWHFGFQVANLWLILIGGSLIDQLQPLIDDPASIFKLLAKSVPGASQFFLNLMITSSFGGLSMELSSVVGVVVAWIMKKIKPDAKKSQRELDAGDTPSPLQWGWLYPPIIFQILVSFVYAPIVPIMLPFAAVYFGLAYLVYKHRALHVYAQSNEGGGALWPVLYNRLIACLFCAEGIFFAYVTIKEGFAQSILSLILVGMTIAFNNRLHATFIQPSSTLALEKAREVDKMSSFDQKRSVRMPGDTSGSQNIVAPIPQPKTQYGYDNEDESKEDRAPVNAAIASTLVSVLYTQPALRPLEWVVTPGPYRRAGTGVPKLASSESAPGHNV